MKKIVIIFILIILGIFITFFYLNQEKIYDDDYVVYALEITATNNFDEASNILDTLPSGIMLYDNSNYKLYAGIYEDIDLVNRMIANLLEQNIKVYLDTIKVNNTFYKNLINYEKLIRKTSDEKLYDNLNQSILNSYAKSVQNA